MDIMIKMIKIIFITQYLWIIVCNCCLIEHLQSRSNGSFVFLILKTALRISSRQKGPNSEAGNLLLGTTILDKK